MTANHNTTRVATAIALLFLTAATILGFSGCKGDKGDTGPIGPSGPTGSSDKQTRLVFSQVPFGTADTTWISAPSWFALLNFSKLDYPGVDSIVFVAFAGTLDTSTATGALRLKDSTNNIVISNSMVTAHGPGIISVQSGNIFGLLPTTAITIIPQIRNERQGSGFKSERMELILYRK